MKEYNLEDDLDFLHSLQRAGFDEAEIEDIMFPEYEEEDIEDWECE